MFEVALRQDEDEHTETRSKLVRYLSTIEKRENVIHYRYLRSRVLGARDRRPSIKRFAYDTTSIDGREGRAQRIQHHPVPAGHENSDRGGSHHSLRSSASI